MAGQWIDIAAKDGGSFKGYLVGPPRQAPVPASCCCRRSLASNKSDARGRRPLR